MLKLCRLYLGIHSCLLATFNRGLILHVTETLSLRYFASSQRLGARASGQRIIYGLNKGEIKKRTRFELLTDFFRINKYRSKRSVPAWGDRHTLYSARPMFASASSPAPENEHACLKHQLVLEVWTLINYGSVCENSWVM
jgi:hypothetical protein